MLQNVHRIEGDVTYISLTRGQETMISTVDLERVLQVRWYAEYIAAENNYRPRGRYQGKPIFLSRYLLEPAENEWVDHINFETLDNRRENLRIVTPSENRLHQRRKPGATGLLHIHALKETNGRMSYYATMMREGVSKARGFPYTPEGLQSAKDLVARWEEDFSYDPARTTQRRPRRLNALTATSVETGPHVDHKDENDRKQGSDYYFDEENAVYIELSRGQRAIIDKIDSEKINSYSWHATPNEMGTYYACASIERKTTYMHRFLLDAPKGMYVDHLNHDTLDNRRANLRLVTNQENNVNRNGAFNTSKTGIRGVSVHKTAPHKGRNGLMYVFRCHCVTCKIAKYFPYTEEGLREAKTFAEAHYAAMKTD